MSFPVTKALAAAYVAGMNADQVAQFVTGLLDGLVQDNDFDKIKPCLTDAEVIEVDLGQAVEDFKKKDIADIIKGVSKVGEIIATVDTDLQDCSGMGPDIQRIKVWAAIFKDPIALFKKAFSNTIMNISKIHSDIGDIITDAGSAQMHDMGEKIADILVLQLGPIPKIEELATYSYEGTCRTSHHDENSCNADAACSWCKSAAVASSCNELADARNLPSAVFQCSKLSAEEFLM